MAKWDEGDNVLDLTPDGDSIESAFTKVKNGNRTIYDRMNRLRKLNGSETEPTDINEGEYWLRTTDNTLMRRGATSSEEAVLNSQNQYAFLMSIIFN